VAAFRRGFDFSSFPRCRSGGCQPVSATSAGICEEAGFSWLHPASDRTAPRRARSDSDLFAFLHGVASHESLGDARDNSHRIWRRHAARASRLLLRITHSRHHRSCRHAHRAVRVLVDQSRRRVHDASGHRNGRGSGLALNRQVYDAVHGSVGEGVHERGGVDYAKYCRGRANAKRESPCLSRSL
jgi:hypothetical protein